MCPRAQVTEGRREWNPAPQSPHLPPPGSAARASPPACGRLPTAGAIDAEGRSPTWSLWPGREVRASPAQQHFNCPAASQPGLPAPWCPAGSVRRGPVRGAGPAPRSRTPRTPRRRPAEGTEGGQGAPQPRGAHTAPVPVPGRGAGRAGAPAASEMCKHRRRARRYLRGRG